MCHLSKYSIIIIFQENSVNPNPSTTGTIIPLHIDVTREDVLRESSDCVAGHLPAGERGIRGVINTAGVVHKGRVEHQDTVLWENMLRTNVLGNSPFGKIL